jgi:hypothetical protein
MSAKHRSKFAALSPPDSWKIARAAIHKPKNQIRCDNNSYDNFGFIKTPSHRDHEIHKFGYGLPSTQSIVPKRSKYWYNQTNDKRADERWTDAERSNNERWKKRMNLYERNFTLSFQFMIEGSRSISSLKEILTLRKSTSGQADSCVNPRYRTNQST